MENILDRWIQDKIMLYFLAHKRILLIEFSLKNPDIGHQKIMDYYTNIQLKVRTVTRFSTKSPALVRNPIRYYKSR